MNDKERKLILKDICGRLPWGVFVKATGPNAREDAIYDVCEVDIDHEKVMCTILGLDASIKFAFDIGQVKPILRPMEDMNPKEKEDYHRILALDVLLEKSSPDVLMDFFHSKGFDCRNLIRKGLAILSD